MIGLEYIAKTFHMSFSDIANILSITRKSVSNWVNGWQPIPKKHLKTLSAYFGINEEYFQKELNEAEKLEIQLAKIKQEIQDKDDQEQVISILEEEIEKEKLFISLRKCIENDEQYEILKNVNRVLKQDNNLFNQTLQILLTIFNHDPAWGGDPLYGIQDVKLAEDLLHILKKHNIITW
jgi:transcriptional regulator with XRE-family HTH domain